MKLFLLLVFSFHFGLSAEARPEVEISGNVEAQARQANNNTQAKTDLFQRWNNENFYLLYGNLNGKVDFDDSRLEANWFGRYSQSDLYEPRPYLATNIFLFPNKLVARDLFKLQYDKQNDDHRTESILNKFYYEGSFKEHRFMVGRIYVNYGLGEIFNPINPFNQPTGLTAISQVAQGNDGVSFTYFLNDNHTIQFLLLGDKSYNEYEGEITKTLWAHGEIQADEKLQLDYVIGEDQERYKLGGQVSYRLKEAMVFTQLLYQSENLKNKPSHNLWDVLIGLDQQMNNKWHLRFEGGHQKSNRFSEINSLGERFLPTEYFVALANVYEVHPLLKINGTLINDIKSGFTYFIAKFTYNASSNVEAEIFGYSPIAKGDSADNPAQKLVTTDIGIALRAFF